MTSSRTPESEEKLMTKLTNTTMNTKMQTTRRLMRITSSMEVNTCILRNLKMAKAP